MLAFLLQSLSGELAALQRKTKRTKWKVKSGCRVRMSSQDSSRSTRDQQHERKPLGRERGEWSQQRRWLCAGYAGVIGGGRLRDSRCRSCRCCESVRDVGRSWLWHGSASLPGTTRFSICSISRFAFALPLLPPSLQMAALIQKWLPKKHNVSSSSPVSACLLLSWTSIATAIAAQPLLLTRFVEFALLSLCSCLPGLPAAAIACLLAAACASHCCRLGDAVPSLHLCPTHNPC